MMQSSDIAVFQSKIRDRYTQHKRDLPRRDTFDLYSVLVSETMLQQTQVDRVIPKYLHWMETLPSMIDIAGTDKHSLLSLWSGLGFNSRAIRLQQAAQQLVELEDTFSKREDFLTLPGVGPYTSGAIMAFVYNADVAVIDTNIRRVLIRELGLEEDLSAQELEDIALACLPSGQANDRYNALMDYGALVATAKVTGIKPLSKQSKFEGSPRQTRGRILRYLLEHQEASEADLRQRFSHAQFDTILVGMARDEIIQRSDGQVVIAS